MRTEGSLMGFGSNRSRVRSLFLRGISFIKEQIFQSALKRCLTNVYKFIYCFLNIVSGVHLVYISLFSTNEWLIFFNKLLNHLCLLGDNIVQWLRVKVQEPFR